MRPHSITHRVQFRPPNSILPPNYIPAHNVKALYLPSDTVFSSPTIFNSSRAQCPDLAPCFWVALKYKFYLFFLPVPNIAAAIYTNFLFTTQSRFSSEVTSFQAE